MSDYANGNIVDYLGVSRTTSTCRHTYVRSIDFRCQVLWISGKIKLTLERNRMLIDSKIVSGAHDMMKLNFLRTGSR